MTPKFVQPFRTGDVVYHDGKGNQKFWKGEHIINGVSVDGVNHYSYTTNNGAWINHKRFKLVRECDKASITQLLKETSDEEEDWTMNDQEEGT